MEFFILGWFVILFFLIVICGAALLSCQAPEWMPAKVRMWLMPSMLANTKFDSDWDRQLNELLDSGEPIVFCYPDDPEQYTCRIGHVRIWLRNFPYASFSRYYTYGAGADEPKSPSKKTAAKLINRLETDLNWKPK
jgi:hypothetical protein